MSDFVHFKYDFTFSVKNYTLFKQSNLSVQKKNENIHNIVKVYYSFDSNC